MADINLIKSFKEFLKEETEKIRIAIENSIFENGTENTDNAVLIDYEFCGKYGREQEITDTIFLSIILEKDDCSDDDICDWNEYKFSFDGIASISLYFIIEIIKLTITHPENFDNFKNYFTCPDSLEFLSNIPQNPIDIEYIKPYDNCL